MRILVTGGGGFLGSHIVRAHLARGDAVRVFQRSPAPEVEALGAECFRGDIRNQAQVEAALSDVQSVIHVASKAGIWGTRAQYHSINVEGTRNLLAASKAAGVGRFIYTSSPNVVIGEGGLEGADETTPYPRKHLFYYPESKAQAERLVLKANAPGAFHTVSLRPHLIFGPGDPHFAPRLKERSEKKKLRRIGDGQNRVDVTFVENAAHAHLLAHDAAEDRSSPVCGRAYFIGQERPVRLWDFIDALLEAVGGAKVEGAVSLRMAKTVGHLMQLAYRGFGIQAEPLMTPFIAVQAGTSHWFTHTNAARDFAYRPTVSIEQGLAKVAAWHGQRAEAAPRAT